MVTTDKEAAASAPKVAHFKINLFSQKSEKNNTDYNKITKKGEKS